MCEFCIKHGEGKKWYLQAKNYAEDLLSDLRRRNFIIGFFGHPEHVRDDRVSGAAAAGAADPATLGEIHDLLHDEEVLREAELFDDAELLLYPAKRLRNDGQVALLEPVPCHLREH